MKNKSILIIGFGSAGKRFSKIFSDKGFKVHVFQHRNIPLPYGYFPFDSNGDLSKFYCAVIASSTSTHISYIKQLTAAKIPTLVEKPISDEYFQVKNILGNLKSHEGPKIQVGFNLRYLPIIDIISKYLAEGKLGKILYADLYVGQYLPFWRPEGSYSDSYSASFFEGGGVSLDLIHELDLAYCWFGNVNFSKIFSAKLSKLKIDCEDFVRFETKLKPIVRVTLDYLNHVKSRRYILVGDAGSIECDIVSGLFKYVSSKGKMILLSSAKLFDIKATYIFEINDFLYQIKKGAKFDTSERALGLDCLKTALEGRKHLQK